MRPLPWSKEFNDLRGILTGYNPAFTGQHVITTFGRIISFEHEERTGSKSDKKLITLSAQNQTNHVKGYDRSTWDWIRLYWTAYAMLKFPGFADWKEIVKDIRLKNGSLAWPDLDNFKHCDEDLKQFCLSKGKRKQSVMTMFFK